MTRQTQLANEFAAKATAAQPNHNHDTKVFAGASSAMMASRAEYIEAHERAMNAMTWCDMRRIEYTDAAEAIATYRAATTVEAR